MFERLGIVTNIWSKEIENGAIFDNLMIEFAANGFRDMEVREGDYLRNSEFGKLIDEIEASMQVYTDAEFKAIYDNISHHNLRNENFDFSKTEHPTLYESVAEFTNRASNVTLSYAMSHPWISAPSSRQDDTKKIITAKKLAYLLCPTRARLRLVDLDTEGEIDEDIAIANLKRYTSLLPEYPMIFAVENARQSATLTLKLAVLGGIKLTYDETNTYLADGSTLNPPAEFWENVQMENLTSVHFKQKTETGVLSIVGDGFVDFRSVAEHLQVGNYKGDLLLENAPTPHSLTDAIKSREYLIHC